MAKRKNDEVENGENVENGETGTDEVGVVRAKMSEMKKLILAIFSDFKDTGTLSTETHADLDRIVPILGNVRGEGVSLESQLAQVNEQIAAHLQAASIVDGKVSTTDAWENDYRILLNRKMRIGKALSGDPEDATA